MAARVFFGLTVRATRGQSARKLFHSAMLILTSVGVIGNAIPMHCTNITIYGTKAHLTCLTLGTSEIKSNCNTTAVSRDRVDRASQYHETQCSPVDVVHQRS